MIEISKKDEILDLLNQLPDSFQDEILKVLREFKAKKDDADFLENFEKILLEDNEVLKKLAQ